jgi:hypothetical protein
MLAAQYEIICEQVSDLSHTRPRPLDSLQPLVVSDFAPFLWSEGFGLGGELHQAIVARQAKVHGARPCLQLEGQRFVRRLPDFGRRWQRDS